MSSRFFPLNKIARTSTLKWYRDLTTRRTYASYNLIEKIVKSPAPNVTFEKGNFIKTLFRDVEKWPTAIALECADTGRQVSYTELREQSARWSGFLKQADIVKGDVISIISPNCMQYGPIFIGTASLGAILSPIDWKSSVEILRIMEVNNPKILIFSLEAEENISKSFKDDTHGLQLMCIGKSRILKALNVDDILYGDHKVQPLDPVELTGDETVYMPFSSGTTGLPKCVDHSHNGFSSAMNQFNNPYHNITTETIGSTQEIVMSMFPLFHIYGLFGILCGNLFKGGKIIVVSRYDEKILLGTAYSKKVSCMYTVPTTLNFLNGSPECNAESMKYVHTIFCGGSNVHPSAVIRLKEKVKNDFTFMEGYGMTEIIVGTGSPRDNPVLGSCGQLLSNVEGKVINPETGVALGPNDVGEICIRSPAIMKGYVNNPKATAEFLVNGWAHTGDLGYYNDDGFFYIVDRIKDLIKVHGMQVSPSEIEEQLEMHPSVQECSVIGIPHDIAGEFPRAFVIRRDAVQEKELHTFLEAKLSAHKRLQGGIRFVDSLPKSEMGKVQRKKLRDMV